MGTWTIRRRNEREEPWTTQHQWLTLPATDEFVFDLEPEAQWAHCLAGAVNLEVKEWF